MKLIEAPVGVFRCGNTLALKTEYFQKLSDGYVPECYILTSGERFWGGVSSAQDFNEIEVEAVELEVVANEGTEGDGEPLPTFAGKEVSVLT